MHTQHIFCFSVMAILALTGVTNADEGDSLRRLPPVTSGAQTDSATEKVPPDAPVAAVAAAVAENKTPPGASAAADTPDNDADPAAEEIDLGILSETEDLSWYQWVLPNNWHISKPWESSFELGMDGSKGDSDTLTLRGGANVKRKVDWSNLRMDIAYVRGSNFSQEIKHNANLDVSHDWLFKDSPWTAFGKMWLVYNEFTDYHTRLTLNTGAGYLFIDNKQVKLKGQLGAGASRRFRGLDRQWVPEGVMGMEYDHQLNERQKIHAEVNYLPAWNDFNEYRVRTEASWEVLLDKKTNMNLKFRITDLYEGDSNPSSPNILHYSMLLLWKL